MRAPHELSKADGTAFRLFHAKPKCNVKHEHASYQGKGGMGFHGRTRATIACGIIATGLPVHCGITRSSREHLHAGVVRVRDSNEHFQAVAIDSPFVRHVVCVLPLIVNPFCCLRKGEVEVEQKGPSLQ